MKIIDLLPGSLPIMEGVIKLPPKLLAKLKLELHTVVVSYLRTRCEEACAIFVKHDATPAAAALALKKFDSYFVTKFPGVKTKAFDTKQKTASRSVGDFEDDDLDPRYKAAMEKSKLNVYYHWNKGDTKPLKLIMALKPTGGLKGSYGQYSSMPNTIGMNLERVKSFAWDEYVEFAQAFLDDNKDVDMKRMERMLDLLADRIEKMEGTLEHEMAHYLQFKVFAGVDHKQVDGDGKSIAGDKPGDQAKQKYFASQIEFDPQVKSNAKDVIVRIKSIRRKKDMDGLPWKPVALVAVGALKAADVMKELKLPSYVDVGGELEFFSHLKRADKDKWKKAVKLFMQTIEDAFK